MSRCREWRQLRASNTTTAAESSTGRPTVITYADDFVALCHSREQAETVTARLDVWLKERGLSLNQEKTRIGRVDAGFDFLSFTIRRYYLRGGAKVLTTPSRTALKKIRQRLAQELRSLRGADPADVIRTLNPIIRGQANYYRPGASTKAFHALDDYLWRRLDKWARRRHPRQAPTLGHRPLLRGLPPHQARPVGVRRPRQRRLPPPLRLDEDRPACAGPGQALTRRPRPGPVLGRPAPQTPDPHNWRRRGSAPCAPNTDAARCAPSPCCTWTTRPTPAPSGRPGTGASARRWPTRPSPRPAAGRRSTASSTPTAHDVTQASDRTTPTSACTMPDRPRGLLEPCAGTTGSHGS